MFPLPPLSFTSSTLLQLLDIVKRYDTLLNVLKSVTRNYKSILLTAILALVLIYLYSIMGYLFFPQDFLMPTNPLPLEDGHCGAGSYIYHRHNVLTVIMHLVK